LAGCTRAPRRDSAGAGLLCCDPILRATIEVKALAPEEGSPYAGSCTMLTFYCTWFRATALGGITEGWFVPAIGMFGGGFGLSLLVLVILLGQ